MDSDPDTRGDTVAITDAPPPSRGGADLPPPSRGGPDPAYRARFDELYDQLHRLARRQLASSRRVTLSTTVLVHEAFLRLDGGRLDVAERGPFLALAAKAMRCVLVDHARARAAEKRGGGRAQVTLATDLPEPGAADGVDLLAVEQALAALEALDPRLAAVVECRFYGGLEFQEIAAHLNLTPRTIHRDWRKARAFLATRLGDALPGDATHAAA